MSPSMSASRFQPTAPHRTIRQASKSGGFSCASSYQRFLLTATMDGAQTMNHCGRVNADNCARGEALLNDVESMSIVRVPERRNNDRRVTDVKVRVAGRKASMPIPYVAGHRKLHHFQAVAHQPVVILF